MKKKINLILIILILFLGAFLRLYSISDYMTFLGDEGRDVLVAKSILEGDFTLLGPRSSAGNFFMGPMYYYFITPFLWLWHLDPVGPAIMVALFGIATIFLIYWVSKQFFNETAGLFAASLYAVSTLVIAYSHSSWNPNILPFFALLLLYTAYKSLKTKTPWKYLVATGIFLGISIQLHYLGLLLGFIVAIYLLVSQWYLKKRIKLIPLIKHYLLVLFGFLIGISPFLLFEIRHGFPNTREIFMFIFGDKTPGTHPSYFAIVSNAFFRIFARLLTDFPTPDRLVNFPLIQLQLWGIGAMVFAVASIIALFFVKNRLAAILLSLWLGFGVLLLGFYHKPIYDYLFTFIFPLPFLLAGNLLSQIFFFKGKKVGILGMTLSLLLFSILFAKNIYAMPFKYLPNRQKMQTEEIIKFLIKKTSNQPFNFALLSTGNSDHGYRYYLEIMERKPVTIENAQIDPKRKSVKDQLFIVCEDPSCQPLGNSLWEIAGFGRANISGEWKVSVVKIYKLTHYKN